MKLFNSAAIALCVANASASRASADVPGDTSVWIDADYYVSGFKAFPVNAYFGKSVEPTHLKSAEACLYMYRQMNAVPGSEHTKVKCFSENGQLLFWGDTDGKVYALRRNFRLATGAPCLTREQIYPSYQP